MESNQRYTITSALPYTNGPLHIGHLAGAYIPADIFVRFKRLSGNDVAYICGSDEHGVAISIKAKSEGFDLKGIYLNIEKIMTQNSERKIKELIIDIFIPERTSNETIDFLKKASKECPVTRNLSQEIDIKISWHNE